MVIHISMPVVVSIHYAMTCWREGLQAVGGELRAVREGKEGARERGRNQLLLIHCD